MGTQIKLHLSPSPRETFGVKDQRKGEISLNCEGIDGNLGVPLILSVHMYPWPALYKLPCKLHLVSGFYRLYPVQGTQPREKTG